MKNLDNLLKFDSITESEKVFKKDHNEFNHDEMMFSMALNYQNGRIKENALKEINDTYFSIKWDEFKNLLLSNNFEIGLSYDFKHDGKYTDEAVLFYHREKGLLIWATSYFNKESLNEAKLHGQVFYDGNIEYKEIINQFSGKPYNEMVMTPELKLAYESLNGFSHDAFMNVKNGIFISLDCREGMFYKLSKVNEHLTFKKQWTEQPFLWFLDYTETKQSNYDYKEITENKINLATNEVKHILNVN